jgi:hypothetical protein
MQQQIHWAALMRQRGFSAAVVWRQSQRLGREHEFLAPDKLLQILTECELGLVRQITDCGHDMDHAMSVPSYVIELLDIVHRNFPILNCRNETARAPPWFPSAIGVWPDMAAGVMLLAARRFSLIWALPQLWFGGDDGTGVSVPAVSHEAT